MSEHPEGGHGNTVAAWTMVAIVIVGSIISGAAFALNSPLTFWLGLVVVALGAVVGKVLQVLGYGQVKADA